MAKVKVDFSKTNGRIRPLHGVNSGPMTKVFTYDGREEFREAGIPYARLHDVEYPYGSGEFVDIHCIFKKFDADENDPVSYSFGLTDKYLEAIFESGCKPLFRLGESIEHAPVKRHVFPPKDYLKWARICEHIIRHYTEGWANGYHFDIEYWEIWNEPDLKDKANWQGTNEDFYELYTVAATYLKSKFPNLKIGGPSFSGPRGSFHEGFFEYITTRDHRVPLDFCSWHRYANDADDVVQSAEIVRERLNRFGYHETESIMDEWNYIYDWNDFPQTFVMLKGIVGAALCAAVLCALQTETDISVANYFEADVVKEWCGLFDVAEMSIGAHGRKASLKKLPTFWAFKAFNELYKLGDAVEVTLDGQKGVKAAAARNGEKNAIFIANYDGEDKSIEIDLEGVIDGDIEVRLTDETHTDEQITCYKSDASEMKITLPMRKNSFAYVGSKLN